ncbi:HDIG domain-containing metalloprotein [Archaeoglobus veneficus]|uniref:Metal dependent phosphohydrolase n=1 Tax=Archaeoglobus veneficus (strain DSM 11195 / SNP6) TaxID=693661 RepID=F2KQ51_ARCVS|nr:HDIG domain-containing metalloprotein [Archaeoglobus veneficus]AEA47654.1 metal dependent phosphohydrolase [Archaeoglobus veneficus SNP6]
MQRDEALSILKKYVKDEKLVKHCIATAAIMREVAEELGENADKWELIGILHDIDYEVVEGDMQKHGPTGYEILKEHGVDEEIAEVVKRHNHTLFGDYEKPVEIALQAADSVSGLIIACALVKGGKITDVTPKTVKKKFKEKSFAAGCDRDRIRQAERLGFELPKFYEIAIRGLVKVKDELGLH